MHISDCVVKDGLGWSEQSLLDEDGCPVDGEIMGEFEYSQSKTTALVHFQVGIGLHYVKMHYVLL